MIENAIYVHTNLIARDWRKLVKFYCEIFGCEIVPPERDLSGKEIEAGTGIKNARISGVHLRLPGCGNTGPTLEIFSYRVTGKSFGKGVNTEGFGHIAFQVEDIENARNEILSAGGLPVGEIVTVSISPEQKIKWCYVTDPEGNIIELQKRSGK